MTIEKEILFELGLVGLAILGFIALRVLGWALKKVISYTFVFIYYIFNICIIVVLYKLAKAGANNKDVLNGIWGTVANWKEVINLTFNK
jgi:hypothetical protein